MTNQVTDHGLLNPTMAGIRKDTDSADQKELAKSLHAGKVPEAYKGVLFQMEVKGARRKVTEESDMEGDTNKSVYGTPKKMKSL